MTTPRTFESICDVCLRDLTGHVVRTGDDVHYVRHCPEHGERRFLISRNGADFERFDRAYHQLFPETVPASPPLDTFFFLTNACNQGCLYCLNESNAFTYFEEYEVDRFEADMRAVRSSKVSLIGGEPFSHPRFFELAQRVCDSGRSLSVFTNGLALAEESVVRRLASMTDGRCEIRMTFEGFRPEQYAHLPVGRVHERKLAALANLEKYRLPTAIDHTFEPGEIRGSPAARQDIIREIVDYAAQHDFVRGLAFQGAAAIGGSRLAPPEEILSVDRVMDDVAAALPARVERRHVYVAQKLVGLMAGTLGFPVCEHVQIAVLFRLGERWVDLNHFVDCDALDRALDDDLSRGVMTRPRAGRLLLTRLLAAARPGRLPSLLRLMAEVVPVFRHGLDFTRIPRTVLPIASITICDRYNYDASIARHCEKSVRSRVAGETVAELCSEMAVRHLRQRAPSGRALPVVPQGL